MQLEKEQNSTINVGQMWHPRGYTYPTERVDFVGVVFANKPTVHSEGLAWGGFVAVAVGISDM